MAGAYGIHTERWGWQPAAWVEAGLPAPAGTPARTPVCGRLEEQLLTPRPGGPSDQERPPGRVPQHPIKE